MLSDRLVAAIKLLEIRSAQSAASFRRETYRLQEAFMRFTQRYWFTEVSDQAQTRDLFRMQRAHLGNDDLYKELRNEIFDMVQYLDSDVLRGNMLGDPTRRRIDVYVPHKHDGKGLPLLCDLAAFLSGGPAHSGWKNFGLPGSATSAM